MTTSHRARCIVLMGIVLALALVPYAGRAQDTRTPAVVWQYTPTEGAIFGRALSADGAGLVVLLGYGFEPGSSIVSLDPMTGAVRWSVDVPEAPLADPLIADGVVYAGIGSLVSGESAVYALDLATGTQIWRTGITNRELPATPVDGLAVDSTTIYVNRGDGVLLALERTTGAERWSVDLGKPQRGVPVVEGDTVVVSTGFDGAAILAFDAATGSERWRFEQPKNPVTGPVVAGGLLYVGFGSGDMVALDLATGSERWRAPLGAPGQDAMDVPAPGLPLVADGVLYVSGNGFAGARTLALDATSGAQLWSAVTGDFSASAPALAGGVLLVGSDSGELLGLDPSTGAELWRLPIPRKIHIDLNQDEPPLVNGDHIYVRDNAGGIVALSA